MKRAGFTMIELIFVIVILGILAAVALPKFVGVSDQAKAGTCKAYVGTLNRTVGPSAWSKSLVDGNGSVSTELSTNLANYIDPPADCNGSVVADINYTIGGSAYSMNFTDGNSSSAPIWTWTVQ